MSNNNKKSIIFMSSLVACLLVVSLAAQTGESRYLPTRADESEAIALRDILEKLAEEASLNQRMSQLTRAGQWFVPESPAPANRLLVPSSSTRYLLAQQMIRRAPEAALMADNGVPSSKGDN